MARMKCPGCGGWYNGRKCPQCLYVPFGFEEEGYRPASTYGKNAAPAPKAARAAVTPQPRKYGQRKTRRAPSGKLAGSIIAMVIVMLVNLAGVAFDHLDDNISFAQPEPAPALTLPAGGLVLYEEDGLLVMADWEEGTPITGEIRIMVQNDTGRDLIVHSSEAAVNGLMESSVFFYCDAADGSISEGYLWITPEELTLAEDIAVLEFCFEAYDAETYETVVISDIITLKTGIESFSHTEDITGTAILDADGIRLDYLGCEESESGTYIFRFFADNATDRRIYLSSSEFGADGQSTDAFLWQSLLPDTGAMVAVEIYDPEGMELDSLAEIETLEFVLFAEDPADWTTILQTEPLALNVHS